MSSYLLDVVCSRCHFEHWSCNWYTSVAQTIHCHYKVFWDIAYRSMLDVISKKFIIPLYQLLFGEEPPCMSQRAMRTVVTVAHWFPIHEGTIVRVFGTLKAPHALPKFVIDRTLIQEVCYQMTQGFSKVLNKGKKKPCPPFPLTIRAYVVENFKQVEAEAKELDRIHLVTLNYQTYDPEKVVVAHCKKLKFSWSYAHTRKDIKDRIRNWYNSTREIKPSEQQAIEDELLDDFHDDVSLRERTSKGVEELGKRK